MFDSTASSGDGAVLRVVPGWLVLLHTSNFTQRVNQVNIDDSRNYFFISSNLPILRIVENGTTFLFYGYRLYLRL